MSGIFEPPPEVPRCAGACVYVARMTLGGIENLCKFCHRPRPLTDYTGPQPAAGPDALLQWRLEMEITALAAIDDICVAGFRIARIPRSDRYRVDAVVDGEQRTVVARVDGNCPSWIWRAAVCEKLLPEAFPSLVDTGGTEARPGPAAAEAADPDDNAGIPTGTGDPTCGA